MHRLTVLVLLISQYLDNAGSTRLPLEVYELTPAAVAGAGAGAGEAQPIGAAHAAAAILTAADLKHKTLEYTTYDAKDFAIDGKGAAPAMAAASVSGVAGVPTSSTTRRPVQQTTEDIAVVSISAEQQAPRADASAELDDGFVTSTEHRRSRQMLTQGHRFGHEALQRQQHQQQQQQLLLRDGSEHGNTNNRKSHARGSKDVRILYQVGDSEADLPICAPNAVCSKIDLYETPWIERQCRCPESNRMPNAIVHHHHHHNNAPAKSEASDNTNNNNNNNNNNNSNNKYRSYYEKEKLMQHKRLLLSDFNDKKFESLHLKKLMQKLGAVYEDDLQLQPSDYLEQDYNDALLNAEAQNYGEINDNEFPHGGRRGYGTAHMRHSGHRGSAKEADTFISGCPSSLGIEDGHTIADKTRHYKLCQPVHKLPVCKHFRDYTWTLTTSADLNVTEQIVHCRCPKNSVTYLTKREPAGTNGYTYLFACSPLTRIRCQRKQPCKLFTVRKRQEFLDEVNINSLCQCPKGHHCPSHHTQSGVIAGESFLEDNIQTYSGYCMAND